MQENVARSAKSNSNESLQAVCLPLTYRALAVEQPGMPLIEQQRTVYSLEEDEVLVRIDAASVNNMDVALARVNAFQFATPYVLGFDFAGQVARVGSRNDGGFEVGDHVLGRSLGGGCFAEYLVVKKANTVKNRGVPQLEASALGIAFLTAYESLVLIGDVARHRGKWIYIPGAAGGVGHFATQIAKHFGLRVIGSAGKLVSTRLLRELGADLVLNHSDGNVTDEILRFTSGKGVDLVYDSTYSQRSYLQSAATIAAGGKYIRLGTEAQLARVGCGDVRNVVEERGAQMLIGDLGRYARDPEFQAQAYKLTDALLQGVTWCLAGEIRAIVTDVIDFDADALQSAFETFRGRTTNVGKVVLSLRRDGL